MEKAKYLGVRKQIKSLLVGGVGLLKVILHEITMSLIVIMNKRRLVGKRWTYQARPRPRRCLRGERGHAGSNR